MPPAEFRILAINPGSTSTKFAIYRNDAAELVQNIRHSDAELEPFRGRPILEQQEYRVARIEAALVAAGHNLRKFEAVVGRGGLLPPVASGTYLVDDTMLDELRLARRGDHASNLGAFLAHDLAQQANAPAFIVDPVSVEE